MKFHSPNIANRSNPITFQYQAADTYNSILSSTLTQLPSRPALPSSDNLKKIWYSKSKTPAEISKKRNSLLLTSLGTTHPNPPLHSDYGLKAFQTLAIQCQKHEIYMLVPETIIIGYGFQSPVLLYTNDKGLLKVQQDLATSHLKILIDIFEKYRRNPQQKNLGPLAIRRVPDSSYNRVLMKQGEIVLEWKDAYKLDVVIQRYVLSKGIKTSKIRIAVGNDTKIYKIVNRMRQDFKVDGVSKFSSQSGLNQVSGQKNIFEQIAQDNKSTKSSKFQEFNRRNSNVNMNELVNIPKGFDFLNPDSKKDLDRANTGYCGRKSIILPVEALPLPSKRITGVMEYIESCAGTESTKSLQELQRGLATCKGYDCDFQFQKGDLMYVNVYRDKVNQVFLVKTKNANSDDIYELKRFKDLENALRMVKELQRVLNLHVFANNGLRVTKLVCDFIEDIDQRMYFIGLKSYECSPLESTPLNRSGISASSFMCPGKYCNTPENSSLRKQHTSLKQFVLRKTISIHENISENSLTMPNKRLYDKVQVCNNCYNHYRKRNKDKLPENINSTMSIPKFKDTDASNIFNQINPNNASDTVKLLKKPYRSVSKSAPSKINEPSIIPVKLQQKRSLQFAPGYNFRKEYFAKKIQEIEFASFEHRFYDS